MAISSIFVLWVDKPPPLTVGMSACHSAPLPQQLVSRCMCATLLLSCALAQVLPYMMKWLWGQVPIQADLLQGKVDHLQHAKGRTLASALNYHRGGSTGFKEANAYLLTDSWNHWPDTYGCNHYRNAIVTAAYAISVAKDIYTNDERIGVAVQHV